MDDPKQKNDAHLTTEAETAIKPASVAEENVDSSSTLWLDRLNIREKAGLVFFIGSFLLGLFRPLVGETIFWGYESGWLGCFIGATLATAFVRARRLALENILDKFAKVKQPFDPMYQNFLQNHECGYKPWVFALGISFFFVWIRAGIVWSLIPYNYYLTHIITIIIGSIGFGFLAHSLWLFFAFAYLISQMGLELEKQQEKFFSWAMIESAGKGYARTAVGSSIFSLLLFWLVVSSQSLMFFPGAIKEKVEFAFLMFLLAVGFPLFYLFIPIWRLHTILVKRKDEIRKLFQSDFQEAERTFLEEPNKEKAKRYLDERELFQEIENLPEWPFKFQTLAQLITVVTIPTALFIFKEIVIDVVVELLKK